MTLPSFRPDVFIPDPPALLASRCTSCSRTAFPPRDVCPACGAEDPERVTLPSSGQVYSYTVVRQAPPGTAVPYLLGYVDLVPDGVRVLARLDGFADGELTIGAPVVIAAEAFDGPDSDVVKFVFRSTGSSSDPVEDAA